jgi:hypothetical protein
MNHSSIAILSAGLLLIANIAYAQLDVDDADSLRFQTFHDKKSSSIQLYDTKKGGLKIGENPDAKKIYEEQPTSKTTSTSTNSAAQNTGSPEQTIDSSKDSVKLPTGEKGQRFEIRERYAIGFSNTTPYSIITVIEPLHQKMSSVCSNGWEIIREFYLPVEKEFYKHYEFECL